MLGISTALKAGRVPWLSDLGLSWIFWLDPLWRVVFLSAVCLRVYRQFEPGLIEVQLFLDVMSLAMIGAADWCFRHELVCPACLINVAKDGKGKWKSTLVVCEELATAQVCPGCGRGRQ